MGSYISERKCSASHIHGLAHLIVSIHGVGMLPLHISRIIPSDIDTDRFNTCSWNIDCITAGSSRDTSSASS